MAVIRTGPDTCTFASPLNTGTDWPITGGGTLVSTVQYNAGNPDLVYIATNTTNGEIVYKMHDDGSLPTNITIIGIQLYARGRLAGGVDTFPYPQGTIESIVQPIGVGFSGLMTDVMFFQSLTNPATGIAWTRADIFQTHFGAKITSGGGGAGLAFVRFYQFYLVVVYTQLNWQLNLPTGTVYSTASSQPSSVTLPFGIWAGGVYYPAGTIYTWITSAATPDDTGWWLSIHDTFAGAAGMVDNSRPKDPRGFVEITDFANTGDSSGWLGGFPGPSCVWNNKLLYAEGGYTVGTTSPVIRINDGEFDRPITSLPNTASGVVPKAVMSMLTANGTIYLSTYDTGVDSTDYVGRVFSLDVDSGVLTPVGAAFTTGHIPYALAWHAGRLWCGTHRQSSAASGKIFYFRPGIDTTWTDDYTLSTSSVAGCSSLLSYGGKLCVGTTAAAGTFAKVLVRSELGVYTTSDTGTGGVAAANNGYLALAQFGANLYASFFNPDAPIISKIRKFDGSSWSAVYSGASGTLVPYVGFPTDNVTLLALGGGVGYSAALVSSANGTSWTDRTAFLTQGSTASTGVPVFGIIMH